MVVTNDHGRLYHIYDPMRIGMTLPPNLNACLVLTLDLPTHQ